MYNIYYYKEDIERQITVEDIHSLRDIAFMLSQSEVYFNVYQGHFQIDCSAIGFQDKGFWLAKGDYFNRKENTTNVKPITYENFMSVLQKVVPEAHAKICRFSKEDKERFNLNLDFESFSYADYLLNLFIWPNLEKDGVTYRPWCDTHASLLEYDRSKGYV